MWLIVQPALSEISKKVILFFYKVFILLVIPEEMGHYEHVR